MTDTYTSKREEMQEQLKRENCITIKERQIVIALQAGMKIFISSNWDITKPFYAAVLQAVKESKVTKFAKDSCCQYMDADKALSSNFYDVPENSEQYGYIIDTLTNVCKHLLSKESEPDFELLKLEGKEFRKCFLQVPSSV